jgi:hypothetical protein
MSSNETPLPSAAELRRGSARNLSCAGPPTVRTFARWRWSARGRVMTRAESDVELVLLTDDRSVFRRRRLDDAV